MSFLITRAVIGWNAFRVELTSASLRWGLFRTGAEIGSFLLTLPGFSAETGVTLAAGGQERVDEKYAVSVLCKLNSVSANNTNHASFTSQPLLDVPR